MSTLLILGASARAAAGSALRAGFTPWCADLFADADLRLIATAARCALDKYPIGLVDILRTAPDAPWIYTGALENHPGLIRQLSEIRPLMGNGPDALRKARSPFVIGQILREAGLPTPEVRSVDFPRSTNKRWLRKPFASAAGNGIEFVDARNCTQSKRHYFQQFIPGVPMSAVFSRSNSDAVLLGASEQLIGIDWLQAAPFRYAGNLGPIDLTANLKRDLQLIGNVLGERCGLVGLFGVDFILHDDHPWVVEVNPRYTASIEVLELATGLKSLAIDRDPVKPSASEVVGKAIWYAPRRLIMPEYEMIPSDLGVSIRFVGDASNLECADVPSPGEVIEPGWPVMTLFGKGRSRDECLLKLRQSAKYLDHVFNFNRDAEIV